MKLLSLKATSRRLLIAGGVILGSLLLHGVAAAADYYIEAEKMSYASGTGTTFKDQSARGGRGLTLWNNTAAHYSIQTTALSSVELRAKGSYCQGSPHFSVQIDGQNVFSATAESTSWKTYAAPVSVPSGSHKISVVYDNDFYLSNSCDRNLKLDYVLLRGASGTIPATSVSPSPLVNPSPSALPSPSASPTPIPTPTPSPSTAPAASLNPFANASLYVDPYSRAKQEADAWRLTRPADAAQLDKIASRPKADWFGGWNGDIREAVKSRVDTITNAGALPVLVAYNIPQRDCGSYSAGGSGSAEAYRSWIGGFAEGIGTRPAAVILEPDALSMLGCLSTIDQQTRLNLLSEAVQVLEAKPNVAVYLDAGHSAWHSPAEMASRLQQAGVGQAQGFAVNVSNFRTTAEATTYGQNISPLVGGKHFVIDTSRNGLGPTADNQWCNPAGRALGDSPGTTNNPLLDAYLWIKAPGESDGTCNGGPSAGTWWGDYALGLAQRAAY